jgi:class 3 adenylate cyclase
MCFERQPNFRSLLLCFTFSETHNNVTVFFSDIVRFTDISQALSAVKVCTMLDRLYVAFDALANKHEVFKVETIGDAWVGVTNCTCFLTKRDSPGSVCILHCLTNARTFSLFSVEDNQNDTHVKRMSEFAVDAVAAAGNILIDEDDPSAGCLHIRVGFHSGQVVSNVIGSLNPRYGLFGDTMNTASRMESLSASGKIQCSEVSAALLKEQAPDFPLKRRGKVAVKGKGHMTTYWVGSSIINENVDGRSASKTFNDNPAVGFKDPSQADGKKKVRNRPPTKVNMDGSLQSSLKNDPADSAPTFWKSRSKKEKRRLQFASGNASSSQ